MKKKPLFLISTLTIFSGFSCLASSPAHAEVVYNGKTYYTLFEYTDFQPGGLSIAAINPYENAARFLFRDQDEMMSFMDPDARSELTEAYLYWLDPSIDTNKTNILKTYIASIRDNTYDSDKIHLVFAGNQPSDFEWLTPNQESTVTLSDAGLNNGSLRLYSRSSMFGESFGIVNFAGCLSSLGEGEECTVVYGEDIFGGFIPTVPQVAEPVVEPESEPEPIEPEPDPEPVAPESEPVSEPDPEPTAEPEPTVELVPEPAEPTTTEELRPTFFAPGQKIEVPLAEKPLTEKVPTSNKQVESQQPEPTEVEVPGTQTKTQEGHSFFGLVFTVMAAAAIGIIWLIIPVKRKKR